MSGYNEMNKVELKELISEINEKHNTRIPISKNKEILIDYLETYDDDDKRKSFLKSMKRKRKRTQPGYIKKASNAWIFFTCELREQAKEITGKGNIDFKDAGVKWKSMTDDQKKPYIDMAEADKIRYTREMEEQQQQQDKIRYTREMEE